VGLQSRQRCPKAASRDLLLLAATSAWDNRPSCSCSSYNCCRNAELELQQLMLSVLPKHVATPGPEFWVIALRDLEELVEQGSLSCCICPETRVRSVVEQQPWSQVSLLWLSPKPHPWSDRCERRNGSVGGAQPWTGTWHTAGQPNGPSASQMHHPALAQALFLFRRSREIDVMAMVLLPQLQPQQESCARAAAAGAVGAA